MRRICLGAATALMLLLATPYAIAQKTVTVQAQDNKFVPEDISIQVGDTINFVNKGLAPHTADDKAGSFSSGNLNPGESKAVTFSKAGTFQLVCIYHEALGMAGRIVVGEGAQATPPASAPATPAPSPAAVAATKKQFDPNAGVPIGMKVFPYLAGGLLLLLGAAIVFGYIRTVQKTTESQ